MDTVRQSEPVIQLGELPLDFDHQDTDGHAADLPLAEGPL
jgi:hypothetical protein